MSLFESVNQLLEFEKLSFKFFCDLTWASTYTDHRLKIRKNLYRQTKNKSVLDLQNIPKLENQFVSISHCPKIGGYVIADQNIGLDIEQFQRLSLSLISRISSDSERSLFEKSDLAAIWTIKESVFKCSQGLCKTMTEVQIEKVESYKNKDFKILKVNSKLNNFKYYVITLISELEDVCLSFAIERL